jgi:hypothetical protein
VQLNFDQVFASLASELRSFELQQPRLPGAL